MQWYCKFKRKNTFTCEKLILVNGLHFLLLEGSELLNLDFDSKI